MARAEAEHRERQDDERRSGGARPEDGDTGFPGDRDGDRREHRRRVPDDGCRIESGEPRDEREQTVPQRKCVAGVQAAVLELVDRPQMQRRQVDELADARLVKEAVAGDRALDVPEEPAEDDADEPDRRPWLRSRAGPVPVPGEQRGDEDDGENGDRQVDRVMNREHGRPRDEDRRRRPREHRRHRALPEGPRDGPARREDADRAEREAQVVDHVPVPCSVTLRSLADHLPSSVCASPELKKRTPSLS